MKTLLPTSTAGSLPKPSWLAQPETLWSPWKLQGDELIDGKRDALRVSLQEQELAGVDIVSDGEQTRQHFVTTFIEHLNGVDFENRKTVTIRNRYDASVPTVVTQLAEPNLCLWKMRSSYVSKPNNRSSGRFRGNDDDRYAV